MRIRVEQAESALIEVRQQNAIIQEQAALQMNEFLFIAEDAHGRKQHWLATELHEAYHNELPD